MVYYDLIFDLRLVDDVPQPVAREHEERVAGLDLVHAELGLRRDAEALQVAVAERARDGKVALHPPATSEDHVPAGSLQQMRLEFG